MRPFLLTLLLTAAATGCTDPESAGVETPSDERNAGDASVTDGHADAAARSQETTPSNVVVLDGAVDESPDAAFANFVRVDVVGCKDLGDQNCARLAHFRFEYRWESAQQLETRLQASWADSGDSLDSSSRRPPIDWVPFETDALGRAALPLPTDVSGANVLHVRLNEAGWDWFSFPGSLHPGTLDGAAAVEVQSGSRSLRLTLVRRS